MRNLHNILLQEDGIEAWRLFRLWEKLRIRASEYKNHRIFTLRCLHNDLIPVSIKLKSTIKSTRANKILRKAEKDLLQARIKTINFILDNTSKQLEDCRSKLAAIISTQRLRECQDFVDKVSEIRFNKVKQRQLNKFNLLTIRKEGNITRSITNLNYHNINSQTNSQVNPTPQASPPSGEDNRSSQAGPPHGEASTSPPSSQANSQAREGGTPPQAGTGTPPPREDSSLSQATNSSLSQASAPQAGATPPGEDGSLSQDNTSSLSQASAPQAGSTSSLSQASALQVGATPPGEDNSLSQGTTSSPSQASALLPSPEGSRPPNPPGTQAGPASNNNNTLRQGSRCPPRHRPTQASQEVITTSWEGNNPTPPARHPQGSSKEEPNPKWVINLSNKPLTPAQRSVLAKGPNFAVTPRQPPNLEYITAIEAACTKLSQQDAEELRADINRVLRSSHPSPNPT